MANPTVAAGGGGVSGPTAAQIAAGATLPYAAVTGTLAGGDRYATKTTSIRHSVAKTKKGFGSAVAASEVYSETMCLRNAYALTEIDSPAISEASGDTTRTA